MDVLSDIVNILESLQNEQLEVQADICKLCEEVMNFDRTLNELKMIKKDVDDMKASNAKQMDLIKKMEMKLKKINKSHRVEQRIPKRDCKCRKMQKSIEEFTPSCCNEDSRTTLKNENSGQDQALEFIFKMESEGSLCCAKKEILERYLQDTQKYRKKKKLEERSSSCCHLLEDNSGDSLCSNLQEIRANGTSPKCKNLRRNIKAVTFHCPLCRKMFSHLLDYSRHKKLHMKSKSVTPCRNFGSGFYSKRRLKRDKSYKTRLRNFKGFSCCYCQEVCCSPEKLTAHLRKCRIITKRSHKRKNH